MMWWTTTSADDDRYFDDDYYNSRGWCGPLPITVLRQDHRARPTFFVLSDDTVLDLLKKNYGPPALLEE